MWSRLLELLPSLVEAIPHLDRFSSVADRFLASNANAEASLAAITGNLRRDLTRIDTGNVSLSRQMDTLAAQVTAVGEAADGARRVTIALGHTIVAIERQLRTLRALLVSTVILVVFLLLAVAWLLLMHTH